MMNKLTTIFLLVAFSLQAQAACLDLFRGFLRRKNLIENSPEYSFKRSIGKIERTTSFLRRIKENPEPSLNLKVWKKIAKLNEFLLNGSHAPNERTWRTFFREFEANFISFKRSKELIDLIQRNPTLTDDAFINKLKSAGYPPAYVEFIQGRLVKAGDLSRLREALNLEVKSNLVHLGNHYHEYRMIRGHLEELVEKEECNENCKGMVKLLMRNLGSESGKEKMMFEIFFEGEGRPDIRLMRELLYQEDLFIRTRLKRERNAEFFGFLKSIISQPEFIDTILGFIYKSQRLGKNRAVKLFRMVYDAQARNIYLPKINRLIHGPKEADKALDLLQNLNAPIAKDELLITFGRLVDKISEGKWDMILKHAKQADPDFHQRMLKAKDFAKARGDLSATNPRSAVGTVVALAVIAIPSVGYFYFDALPTSVQEYVYGDEESQRDNPEGAPDNIEGIELDGEEDLMIDEATEIIADESDREPSSMGRPLPFFTEAWCSIFQCSKKVFN
ncbi:MAG: hypothetical protein NXH75_09615 [Halobacteriovoraceae bacterium]|nr:hypothetical protein [Halobacteriovoraceae bacterium]